MINYLRHHEIDKKKWDECITGSFNGNIYAYSWYLDIVCEGWEALVEDGYQSVFPLTGRKKYNISYLFQPLFSQQLGIFSKNVLSEETVKTFLLSVPEKYKFIEINLNKSNQINDIKGFNIIQNRNCELSLISSYENIFKNYSSNVKRNIKKAEESGIHIAKTADPDGIIGIFKNNKGKRIYRLNDNAYSALRRLLEKCLNNGMAEIWGAYTTENELCAGAFFIRSFNKMVFLFSGTDSKARECGAMPLLIDIFIKEHCGKNLVLDFEGSNDENLAKFYNSFGAEECFYPHIRKNGLPFLTGKGVMFVKFLKRILKIA